MDPPPPPQQPPQPPPSSSSDSSSPPHNHLPHTGTCCKCGGPTTHPPPHPPPPTSTPSYIPIRLPAINLPPPSSTTTTSSIISTPVPRPLPVPPLSPPYNFLPPSKHISSPSSLSHFLSSSTSLHFLGFISSLSSSSLRLKLSDPLPPLSPTISSILSVLDSLSSSVDSFPPLPQSSRYGNPAFKSWHQHMSDHAEDFMLQVINKPHNDPIRHSTIELVPYFTDSFGNAARIDYGTGHETNFAAWLYCLARLGLVTEEDYPALVTRVFTKYLDLMRKLQLTYSLEPAGSHGVWGLDDYHFLPFVFGSAQLVDHKYMKPKSIHNEDILENFSDEYMYLACIRFIKKVKKGPFAEHSPLLDDISGVPSWSKVNGGLLKMYRAEVLGKLPVVQHFLFGSIIPWEE